MTKRKSANSIESRVKAAQNAALGPLEPPAHVRLRDGDRPFWDSIVSARARETWTATDLETAANLARTKADIERVSRELEVEGDVIENARGTAIMNPKHTILEQLSRRAMALSRIVHVHAEATVGRAEQGAKRAGLERAAQADNPHDDGLIPSLRVVHG